MKAQEERCKAVLKKIAQEERAAKKADKAMQQKAAQRDNAVREEGRAGCAEEQEGFSSQALKAVKAVKFLFSPGYGAYAPLSTWPAPPFHTIIPPKMNWKLWAWRRSQFHCFHCIHYTAAATLLRWPWAALNLSAAVALARDKIRMAPPASSPRKKNRRRKRPLQPQKLDAKHRICLGKIIHFGVYQIINLVVIAAKP